MAERLYGLQVVRVERAHATFALNDLDENGGAVLGVKLPFECGKVARGHVAESRREGPEELVERVLPRGGDGRERAAVEAVDERDEGMLAFSLGVGSPLSGGLDQALVGLGA